jgi:hypothetical protein
VAFDRRPALVSGVRANVTRGRPSVAVDKADRFWPGVSRLVVPILIVLLVLAVIVNIASATLVNTS